MNLLLRMLVASLVGAATASIAGAKVPRGSNLLQASRLAVAEDHTRQQPTDFFVKDFERMDELPEYNITKPRCHPKCKWSCSNSKCNTRCQPRCQPPKCVTACKKPTMAKCKRVCKDPLCAVVCPPQCEHGTCPKCKTVCNEPVCDLECGQGRCESHCADPDCVWDCAPDPVCAKPECKLKCDTTVCTFGKDQKLPNDHDAPYLGEEIAWKGLGKIPVEHLGEFGPKSFTKVELPKGAKLFGGAKMVPPAGLKSITGETGVKAVADVTGVRQIQHAPGYERILVPNRLTAR